MGEIQVRGKNVTNGYWKDEQATAAAFDEGWLKTGDAGYIDKSGYLYLQGRLRHMIVLPSGMNVFPEDIEATLLNTGMVDECAVVGFPRDTGPMVHAVFPNTIADRAEEVVRLANISLGDHQRIVSFSIWPNEHLPMTHTLKVKKGDVLDWLETRSLSTTPDTKPKDAGSGEKDLLQVLQSVVVQLPSQVTPQRQLGPNLGLDSLGRIELVVAVEEQLGVSLDEESLRDDTTIKELQDLIERGTSSDSRDRSGFPSWGRRWWARTARGIAQPAFLSPYVRAAFTRHVTGKQRLRTVHHPVIFVANHNLRSDVALILRSLPFRVRRRLAVAAAADL